MVTIRRVTVKCKDNVTMVAAVLHRNKVYLAFTAVVLTVIVILTTGPKGELPRSLEDTTQTLEEQEFEKKVQSWWWTLRKASMKNLSKLGEVLYLDGEEPPENAGKSYRILVWKYGPTIENRHLKNFSGKKVDPFEHCPVNNCNITYEDSALSTADLVIFHLHRLKGVTDLPQNYERPSEQIWAFLTDESPYHTFMESKSGLKDFNGVFNWSMTYRSDSDIPVPYGRTVLRTPPDLSHRVAPKNKRRDVLVAVLGSNCGGQNHRWNYVRNLTQYMKVDVYGGCGTALKKQCPGHFTSDCNSIDDYLFYLAFENSNCDEYVTEKLWWNAYHKDAIPIVMGSSVSTHEKLLPVDSYIDVELFANPRSLAEYLLSLNKTGSYTKYYKWKSHFRVFNEHGYFQSRSYHYCRACQALNYNSRKRKVYDDLEKYWRDGYCHKAWDEPQ